MKRMWRKVLSNRVTGSAAIATLTWVVCLVPHISGTEMRVRASNSNCSPPNVVPEAYEPLALWMLAFVLVFIIWGNEQAINESLNSHAQPTVGDISTFAFIPALLIAALGGIEILIVLCLGMIAAITAFCVFLLLPCLGLCYLDSLMCSASKEAPNQTQP